VALLPNPRREIAPEILESWAARVARARSYGNIRQAPGEVVLVSERGLLEIAWPILIADNNPVPLDLLLSTATQPDLMGDPPRYPTPAMIAERWRNDREDNVRYFRKNLQSGIRTFEDEAIQTALAEITADKNSRSQ
jgi:hypothetical protein